MKLTKILVSSLAGMQATDGFDERKYRLCAALRDEAMLIDRSSSVSTCAHFGAFTAHVGKIPAKLGRNFAPKGKIPAKLGRDLAL